MSGRVKLWTMVSSLIVLTAVGAGLLYARSGSAYSLAEYRVANLTCRACVQKIDQALSPLPGIGRVEVSVEAGRAQVEFDPSKTDPGQIRNAIMGTGYPALLVRTSSAADSRAGEATVPAANPAAGGESGCACCERN